jgi:ligand-binding SRPBCC domain-containing protein
VTAPFLRIALAGLALLASKRLWLHTPRYTLQRSQVIRAAREAVFSYFADPRNLPDITPPSIGFEVVDLETVPLTGGTMQRYRIHWFGIPLQWESIIAEYTDQRSFTDVQTSGPYRYWRHEHSFEDMEAATAVRDHVEYELPLGVIGRVVHALAVRRQLREIFDYRERAVAEAFRTHERPQPPGGVA